MSAPVKAYIHSADLITPQALEIMAAAKKRVLGDLPIEFDDLPEYPPVGCTVFALGNYKATQDIGRVIPAPSVAQICTSPETVTRLGQAFQLLVNPPVLNPYEYEVFETTKDAIELLSRRGQMFAFDLEWSGVNDPPSFDRILCVGIYDGEHAYVIPEEMVPELRTALNGFLEGNGIITVNGKGDLSYFPSANVPVGAHFDCMLAHYSLFPAAAEHGLKPVTKRMFGFEDWDANKEQYLPDKTYEEYEKFEDGSWHDARHYPRKNGKGSGYERIPRAILYEYNGFDVYATWHWFVRMREMLAADADAMRVFRKRMALSALFQQIEGKKFHVNVPYLHELEAENAERWEIALADFHQIAGAKLNPNSHVQMKKWFVENDHELPKQKIKSGPKKGLVEVSSNEDSMKEVIEGEAYSERSKEFAEALLNLRGITKETGTYIKPYIAAADERGGIRPDFILSGPVTGRLANRGPGVMTIPRDPRLRKMVVPSGPGRVLVKPDYGQLEMRIVAAESGDVRYIAAFQPGMPDFFVSIMPELFPEVDFSGLTPEQMHKHPLRNRAKPVSHGTNYGLGLAALAKSLKMPVQEAKKLRENYLGPEGEGLRAWQNELRRKVKAGEPIVTPYGFHLQSELVTHQNQNSVENQALSFPGQSTGNDMCLEAALRIQPLIEPYDAWIVGTVHDQVIVDAPIEHASAVGAIMQLEMEQEGRNIYGDLLVFEAEPEYGFNWSEKMDQKQWDAWLAAQPRPWSAVLADFAAA